MSDWRDWLALGAATLGGLTLLGTLLGFLASWGWVLDLIANFRFQYLWIGALAVAVMLWRRWWWPAAAVGFGVLINLILVSPYYLGSVPAAGADSPQVTVAHLNTLARNSDKTRVVDFIREVDADFVFLTEVTTPLVELIESADQLPYEIVVGTSRTFGVMGLVHERALAADPTINGHVTNLGETRLPGVVVEARLGDQFFEMLAFQTSSPGRAAKAEGRDSQLAGAAQWVAERETPVLLIGDFNATPWTPAFADLVRTANLTDSARGRGFTGSWPDGWGPFKIPIDHALHSEGLTTVRRERGPSAGSDHRSLLVTLALSEPR